MENFYDYRNFDEDNFVTHSFGSSDGEIIEYDEIIPFNLNRENCVMHFPEVSSIVVDTVRKHREKILSHTPFDVFTQMIIDHDEESEEDDKCITISHFIELMEKDVELFKRFCLALNDYPNSDRIARNLSHLLAKDANMEHIFIGI